MKYFILLTALSFTLIQSAKAQPLDSLNRLSNRSFAVYYSSGHQQRTELIALHLEKALSYYQSLLEFKPDITLLVLSAKDWKTYTTDPVVYGMPHHSAKSKRLIVAAEDNRFWKSFLPPLDRLPPDLEKPIKAAYSNFNGELSMQPFFDLLVIHELGHAFHVQGGLNMQRKWMGELFTNILLHTYIAENGKELLPALTLFPRMVVAGGTKEFKYTSLQDIQDKFDEIALQYPKNYGWYQCSWHYAAAGIYEAAGKQAGRKLWDALKEQQEILSDQDLIEFLKMKVDGSVADVIVNWEH